MKIKTDARRLAQYVLSQAADRMLAQRALAFIDPYFKDADAGIYPLTASWHIDDDAAVAAIEKAAATRVGKLSPVSANKDGGRLAQFLDGERMICLPMYIRQARQTDLVARMGRERYEDFVYLLFECLGASMVANLTRSHRSFFDQLDRVLANTFPFVPMVGIFYLLSYAVLCDAAGVRELAPLVRLMRQTLPLGTGDRPGEWLLLVG